jgi:diketogulonate reductase-like aldo/keto reductase
MLAGTMLVAGTMPPQRPYPTSHHLHGTIIPSRPLSGGGEMPMMIMGGDDFAGWFKIAGKGAGINTFHGYGNGAHIAPQLAAVGRENVFVVAGIPCGCCASDSPKWQPMNKTTATWYIDDELRQLNTSYLDLLLVHHRCKTDIETASVWEAFEDAKHAGKARHLGVSNFNTHDLRVLLRTAKEPVEALEAHFGVGVMDFETLSFAREHAIHPISFSSLSETSTDLPHLRDVLDPIAAAHNVSIYQVLYAYVYAKDATVLSSYNPAHPQYVQEDLAIFDVRLSAHEMAALDAVTSGTRTCTDCFTDECQACAHTLHQLGCPLGMDFPVWGRDNKNGTECLACAATPQHQAAVMQACGQSGRGETLETMVPKACGI